MSSYYSGKRTKNIFDPEGTEPFKLSRSKVANFMACPRCFYLDRRLGVGQPPAKGVAHPIMKAYSIDAVPFVHENLDEWRANFTGVQYLDKKTNFLLTGAVDDVWQSPNGELIVVDYKATSKATEVTLDAAWQDGYKRQMEFYQWLLRRNGFEVSDTGYFVYCNGRTDKAAFDGRLEFDIKVIPYTGDDSWVAKTIVSARKCLMSDTVPASGEGCDYCTYREAVEKAGG
jgi:CRISPR/Cas system-associated exonuclease Cas4 (RecB family)